MRILFCNDDLTPRAVDSCFEDQAAAAAAAGFSCELIDVSALRRGDAASAVRFVTAATEPLTAIYRGWMLTPSEYTRLVEALHGRNVRLINSPEEYLHCHWLPHSYSVIESHTPRSVWIPAPDGSWDMNAVTDLLKQFGIAPVIVKDYVKSRKHEWHEACYIPNAANTQQALKIVHRFIELQDDDLQGGLVFREFVELEPIGVHPTSGMPLTREFRLFVLDGSVIAESPYWETQDGTSKPPVEQFEKLLANVESHFFSCDVARTTDGRWLIVELGDGQVAGLPEQCEPRVFYEAVARKVSTQ